MSAQYVVPLESNPDVLNKYLSKLGVSEAYQLFDVYSLDDDALAFLPQPVKAIILLFPCSDAYKAHRDKEAEALGGNPPATPANLFYMRQYVHNSCGTMALVHSILNNLNVANLKDGSVIKNFYEKAKDLSPEERGKLFVADTAFQDVHQALAAEGQTEAPPSDEKIDKHFIAFVNAGDELFELDGSKQFPISHGATNETAFLADAARVCKEFMARDPKDPNFTIMAYANAE